MPFDPPVRCPIDRVAIVVPARDEQRTIARSLEAISLAIDEVPPDVTCHVTVVDDGSVDATGHVAGSILWDLAVPSQVVRVEARCVGAARRTGVEAATAGWVRAERVWTLSTDADSTVRPDWIVAHLEHAARGAVGVSGIVDIVAGEHHSPLRARWWRDYGASIDRHHGHPYAHATNLGVRLDAYRAVGGYADLMGQEDADLWQRLRARGFALVADARIVVDTSDRRIGRVRTGFAHALSTMYPDPPMPLAEDPLGL